VEEEEAGAAVAPEENAVAAGAAEAPEENAVAAVAAVAAEAPEENMRKSLSRFRVSCV
jgi:hypothetical protein